MGEIDVSQLNIDSERTLGTITIDGVVFKSIGYGMLKSANVMSYKDEPTRADDFTMADINTYTRRIVPEVSIGFKLISATEFVKLKTLLNKKVEHIVEYYDNDFGYYVTHRMYVQPAELQDFFSRGQSVIGVQNYTITLVGTMNDEPNFTITYNVEDLVKGNVKDYDINTKFAYEDIALGGDGYYQSVASNNISNSLADTEYWVKLDVPKDTLEQSCDWGNVITIPYITAYKIFKPKGVMDFNGWKGQDGIVYNEGDVINIFENITFYPSLSNNEALDKYSWDKIQELVTEKGSTAFYEQYAGQVKKLKVGADTCMARLVSSEYNGEENCLVFYVTGLSTLYAPYAPANGSETVGYGWVDNIVRSTLNNNIFEQLPTTLQSVISEVSVPYVTCTAWNKYTTLSYTHDKLFLPSAYEVTGSKSYLANNNNVQTDYLTAEGKQFKWYINNSIFNDITQDTLTRTTTQTNYIGELAGDRNTYPYNFVVSRWCSTALAVQFCFVIKKKG